VHEYLRDNAMYIGYAPYDAPEISIAVAIENVGGGGSNAAPLARNVMDYYFDEQKKSIAAAELAATELANMNSTPEAVSAGDTSSMQQ
jgi:penicillin-binding protein 2